MSFHRDKDKPSEVAFAIQPLALEECTGLDRRVRSNVHATYNVYFVAGEDRVARSVRVVFKSHPTEEDSTNVLRALQEAGLKLLG